MCEWNRLGVHYLYYRETQQGQRSRFYVHTHAIDRLAFKMNESLACPTAEMHCKRTSQKSSHLFYNPLPASATFPSIYLFCWYRVTYKQLFCGYNELKHELDLGERLSKAS